MANENNYTVVLMDNPNVTPEFACPKCQNNEIDMLVLDECDNVTCLNCGYKYYILEDYNETQF